MKNRTKVRARTTDSVWAWKSGSNSSCAEESTTRRRGLDGTSILENRQNIHCAIKLNIYRAAEPTVTPRNTTTWQILTGQPRGEPPKTTTQQNQTQQPRGEPPNTRTWQNQRQQPQGEPPKHLSALIELTVAYSHCGIKIHEDLKASLLYKN